jgi:hypothetical protein
LKKEELLKKIAAKAKRDARNRRDRRFLETMGFLTAKGFLETNYPVPRQPNRRLVLGEVIWAGREVEPRILEVLPAAVLRLGAHFDFDAEKHPELACVLTALRNQAVDGPGFCGVPYAKLKFWANFPLPDRRVKTSSEKKISRTFRLRPDVIAKLRAQAKNAGCSDTQFLEKKILAG